jgi:hypothetical protein
MVRDKNLRLDCIDQAQAEQGSFGLQRFLPIFQVSSIKFV